MKNFKFRGLEPAMRKQLEEAMDNEDVFDKLERKLSGRDLFLASVIIWVFGTVISFSVTLGFIYIVLRMAKAVFAS